MTTRMPKARPPIMDNRIIPGIRPISKQPTTNPAVKKARTISVRKMSLIPTEETELMNAAQAIKRVRMSDG
jgi:hypothetical protein